MQNYDGLISTGVQYRRARVMAQASEITFMYRGVFRD